MYIFGDGAAASEIDELPLLVGFVTLSYWLWQCELNNSLLCLVLATSHYLSVNTASELNVVVVFLALVISLN